MNYILWLLIFVCLPTLFLWIRYGSLLWKYKQVFFYGILFVGLFAIPWDLFAIANNIWFWPREGVTGIRLFSIPIEEYLFMITAGIYVCTVALIVKYQPKRT